jgi:hypothetical protein
MTLQKKVEPKNKLPKTPVVIDGQDDITKEELPEGNLTIAARLEELESLPHRNSVLHWAAFTLSLLSLIILSTWAFSSQKSVPSAWVLLDIGLGVVLAFDFLTHSGFRWNRATYLRTHFFDFVAIVPALALVNHGFAIEGVWVWLILVARAARVVDRFLGDGFVQRNALALVDGFEEELTDRVLERIIARIQADMERAGFSHGVAEALVRNKASVLQRVRAATPHEGLLAGSCIYCGVRCSPGARRRTNIQRPSGNSEQRRGLFRRPRHSQFFLLSYA